VGGIDVVAAESARGPRNHHCAYLSARKLGKVKQYKWMTILVMTTTKTTLKLTKKLLMVLSDNLPKVNLTIEVNILNGKGRNKAVFTFYCTVQEYEDDGAVFLLTQDGKVMNIFLEDATWKQIYKCTECNEYGSFALSCDAFGSLRPGGM
jgi:hypothetical protein